MTIAFQSLVENHEILLFGDSKALGITGATVTASSAVTTGNLIANNLLTDDLDTAWRSESIAALLAGSPAATEVTIRFQLGRKSQVNFVSLHRSNIRRAFKAIYYQGDPGTGAAAVYDSGWVDPIVRARLEDFEWLDMPWTLGPVEEDLDLWQSTFRLDSFDVADQVYSGIEYVDIVIDISDPDELGQLNDGVDYLQFSMPMIGKVLQTSVNFQIGWSSGTADRSEVHRTESGSLRGRKRSIGKTLAFNFHALEKTEAFQDVLTRWVRKHGVLGRCFAVPLPTERRFFYDLSFVGTLVTLPKGVMSRLDWPSSPSWLVEETE